AGTAGRIAAVGVGSGAPPRRAGPDPRSRRAGRPHRMTAGDDVQLVTFKVAGQDFAFSIFQVERILRYEAPAPLPKAPDFLEGVLPYQGAAIPLVDLRKRVGVPAPHREETHSRITLRVSARWGAGTPSRFRRSTRGMAAPWYGSTPSRKSGALGNGAGAS